ncbi:hypothetical protein [Paenilisteria newyorkensis]|uniref:hypothetical protein n=1 Tax=Listeria newyorkensis TaxID=1497681 RepID=UPI002359C1F3|nr:hypothetical protein [Listeria newyorkensis]WAO22022.1 hypothetical protein OTR81_01625 [Listeria newyorkensis]
MAITKQIITEIVTNPLLNKEETINEATNSFILSYDEVGLPYDIISQVIFEKNINSESDMELIEMNLSLIKKELEKRCEQGEIPEVDSPRYMKISDKLTRHFSLAIAQRKFIEKSVEKSEETIQQLENEINELTDLLSDKHKELENMEITLQEMVEKNKEYVKNTDDALQNIKNTKGQIYTEFVAILGIFSALIFTLFGGFKTLSESVSALQNGKIPLTNTLIMTSIVLGGLSLLIFSLMQGVAKLSGRNLRTCGCEDRSKCNHSVYERHPMMSWVIFFLFSTFMISLLFKYIPDDWKQSNPLMGLLVVLFYLSAMVIYFSVITRKKESKPPN